MNNNFDLGKARNFLLKESVELEEMAKITGPLETAIKAVITANPELNGLPLKKAIRADKDVLDALDGDDLYDNQLNKFIAKEKGEREVGVRGRKATPAPAKSNMADELGIPTQSLNKVLQEPGFNSDEFAPESEEDDLPIDTWNKVEDDGDEDMDNMKPVVDKSIEKELPSDVGAANNYKNIIVKKVAKIEALPPTERANSVDMAALKAFIKKPEVNKTLGKETIRSLVSTLIG